MADLHSPVHLSGTNHKRKSSSSEKSSSKKTRVESAINSTLEMVDSKALKSFKVPRKEKRGDALSVVNVSSKEFAEDIRPIIVGGLKFPGNLRLFRFHKAHFVHNSRLQSEYNKKKSELCTLLGPVAGVPDKGQSSGWSGAGGGNRDGKSVGECFAFIWVKSEKQVEEMAEQGVKNGNLRRCLLGKPSSGVSVCQFSDIYSCNPMRSGWMLVVKVMCGRVNYVAEDETPLEPQPSYDCHLSKASFDTSTSNADKAFHTTQIYLYEYSEDFDLLDYPRHVLPYAAVEFSVTSLPDVISKHFGSLYARTPHGIDRHNSHDSDHQLDRLQSRTVPSKLEPLKIEPRLVVKSSGRVGSRRAGGDGLLVSTAQLVICGLEEWEIGVELVSYMTNFIPFDLTLIPVLEIVEVCRVSSLYDELSSSMLQATSGQRLEVSREHETSICLDGPWGHTIYLNYLRIVITDASQYRTQMSRLCSYLSSHNSAGKIKLPMSEFSFCYVFPDGTFARSLGIPEQVSLDVNYLHAVIITPSSLNQHLSYIFTGKIEIEESLMLKIWNEPNDVEPPTFNGRATNTSTSTDAKSGQKSKLTCNTTNGDLPTSFPPIPVEFRPSLSLLVDSVEQQSILQKSRLLQLIKGQESSLHYLPPPLNAKPQTSPQVVTKPQTSPQVVSKPLTPLDTPTDQSVDMDIVSTPSVANDSSDSKPYEPDRMLLGLRHPYKTPPKSTAETTKIFNNPPDSPGDAVVPDSTNSQDEVEKPTSTTDSTMLKEVELRKRLYDIMTSLQSIRPATPPSSPPQPLQPDPSVPTEDIDYRTLPDSRTNRYRLPPSQPAANPMLDYDNRRLDQDSRLWPEPPYTNNRTGPPYTNNRNGPSYTNNRNGPPYNNGMAPYADDPNEYGLPQRPYDEFPPSYQYGPNPGAMREGSHIMEPPGRHNYGRPGVSVYNPPSNYGPQPPQRRPPVGPSSRQLPDYSDVDYQRYRNNY